MKSKSMPWVLLCSLPLALFAGSDESVLLSGDFACTAAGKSVAHDAVSVNSTDPTKQLTVRASEIAIEQRDGRNFLTCTGETTVQAGGRTFRGRDVTIELGDMRQNVYLLNPNGIVVNDGKLLVEATPSGVPAFGRAPGQLVETGLTKIPAAPPAPALPKAKRFP
jgi:hypothetical protein